MTRNCDELEIKKGISKLVAKISRNWGWPPWVYKAHHCHKVWLSEQWTLFSYFTSSQFKWLELANFWFLRLDRYKSSVMSLCPFYSNDLQFLRISTFKFLLCWALTTLASHSFLSLSWFFMVLITIWNFLFNLFVCFLLGRGSIFPCWNLSP